MAALSGMPAYARTHHSEAWARDRFAAAERMSEALNGRPPADRKRSDYQRVLNAYRNVYFGAPTSTKADPSVVAVAETLVEMGRRFDDDKILNEAVAQYKFLRKEYPGSKYRCDALFTIGEIYKDDLNDPEHARGVFEEFLHRYPHNRLAEDAQNAIAEMDQEAAAAKKADEKKEGKKTEAQNSAKKAGREAGDKAGDRTKVAKDFEPAESDSDGKDNAEAKNGQPPNGKADSSDEAAESHPSRMPRVTGIRHWSTPDYTRVAIDLESDVKFGSQRISNPDRIFFDLRGTKLASTLVGKSFDVDDGFLKKIRVAQFQPGRTRVVLEVDNLSDYDAFLLPTPYRLIIDIHGKDAKGARNRAKRDALKDGTTALADVEALPKTGEKTQGATSGAGIPAANVPAAELKADVKALAGKAPAKSEQIHGEPLPEAKDEPDGGKAQPATEARKRAGDQKASPVKKVIVEADDDDDTPPVKAAKSEVRTGRVRTLKNETSKTEAKSEAPSETPSEKKTDAAKGEGDPDADSVADDKSSDAPAKSSRGKAMTALSRRDAGVREAQPTASGDRSLIRALGLKIGRIVIDPGHGGHDTGTIGPDGLREKDLVLEVGRRLGKLLETRLGAEVVYTRKDDTFIPLETRTAIANQQRADLFISIHANSSHDPGARGVETYYLNFTSSPEALEVAARENAVSEKSIYELQDLVKKIAMKEKIEESREFAGDVQESLHSGLAAKSPAIRNRGVKKAPFIVLIGANMPSILAEISFVSNPTDEHRLETSDYRQKIAESLYRGIAKYVDGLSGVKVAAKMDKAAGQ